MPKEIRPCAFSSHAVPRSGLSCNLLSLTRAAPFPAVRGERLFLRCSYLGTRARPPWPWCEAAAPHLFPVAPHPLLQKTGLGTHTSVGTGDTLLTLSCEIFPLASQRCTGQSRLAAACSRQVLWSPASGFCCSIPLARDLSPHGCGVSFPCAPPELMMWLFY